MKKGHGITGARLQQLCREGKFMPIADSVLVEAIMEEDATASVDGIHLSDGVEIDARKAIAFRVARVGVGVPKEEGIAENDVVMNISISGERVDASDKACPWWTVRYKHLVGRVKAEDAYPAGYLEEGSLIDMQIREARRIGDIDHLIKLAEARGVINTRAARWKAHHAKTLLDTAIAEATEAGDAAHLKDLLDRKEQLAERFEQGSERIRADLAAAQS